MPAIWVIGLVASATITATFLAVAIVLAINLTKTQQWRRNPLAVGTFMVFFTCAVGHGLHALMLSGPAIGLSPPSSLAARMEYEHAEIWIIDVFTAAAGVWYWRMRRGFPGLVSGTAVFEDLRQRQKKALEIHDSVVQGLVRAKMNLELDRRADGERALGESLEASKKIISDLLGREKEAPKEAEHGR